MEQGYFLDPQCALMESMARVESTSRDITHDAHVMFVSLSEISTDELPSNVVVEKVLGESFKTCVANCQSQWTDLCLQISGHQLWSVWAGFENLKDGERFNFATKNYFECLIKQYQCSWRHQLLEQCALRFSAEPAPQLLHSVTRLLPHTTFLTDCYGSSHSHL